MKNDSHCRKKIYCEFEVILSNQEAQVEVCVNCGKKVIYNKDKQGNVDNKKYLRDHIRDTLQPYGKTGKMYKKIYGHAHLKGVAEMLKKHKKISKDELKKIRGKRKYVKHSGFIN